MRIDVLTLFPEMFGPILGSSILKRAAEPVSTRERPDVVREPVVSYHLHQLRDHTTNKHDKVDKPPYGGGPGMVLQCQPVWDALTAIELQDTRPATRILMTPKGRRLTQQVAEELATRDRLLLLCGHYEGFDQRVLDRMNDEPNAAGGLMEISVGDYVLSGGELPAMTVIDAVVRLLPGVLGNDASADHESFSPALDRGLDYPHYTRPPEWEGRAVPSVLMSGDHAKIEAWRLEQSRQLTVERRGEPE